MWKERLLSEKWWPGKRMAEREEMDRGDGKDTALEVDADGRVGVRTAEV